MVLTLHYSDVMMGAMTSQITGGLTVCSTVCSGADQRKHQSSASLAFVTGIHRWPEVSPHKGPITRKIFSFSGIIMFRNISVSAPGGLIHHNKSYGIPDMNQNTNSLPCMLILGGIIYPMVMSQTCLIKHWNGNVDILMKISSTWHFRFNEVGTFHDDAIKWIHFGIMVFWGESTGHRWIPLKKTSDSELCDWTHDWANNGETGDFRRHPAHCDVTVVYWSNVGR